MAHDERDPRPHTAEIIAFPVSNRNTVERVTNALRDAELLFTKLQKYVVNLDRAYGKKERTLDEEQGYISAQGYVTHAIMQAKKLCDRLSEIQKGIVTTRDNLSEKDNENLRNLINTAVHAAEVAEKKCMMQLRLLHAKAPTDD